MEEEGEKNDNSLDLNSLLHAPVNFFFARQSWLARSMFKGSFFFLLPLPLTSPHHSLLQWPHQEG